MLNKIGSFLGFVSFTLMLLIGGHIKYEQSRYVPPPTIEQSMKNVVSIMTAEGEYCSGWILKGSKTVVTAAHCIPENRTEPLGVDFGDGVIHLFHAEKVGDMEFNQGPDLATLTTSDATVKWPVGMAVCSFKPYYSEQLDLMGGPLGFSQSVTIGRVSNPDRNMDDIVMGPFGHFIQYDGALLPGNSGGPAIDSETGCVMGVADFIYVAARDTDVPFGVNYLTPATELSALK